MGLHEEILSEYGCKDWQVVMGKVYKLWKCHQSLRVWISWEGDERLQALNLLEESILVKQKVIDTDVSTLIYQRNINNWRFAPNNWRALQPKLDIIERSLS